MARLDEHSTNLALNLYEHARNEAFVFSYRGPFHHELTSKFVGIGEHVLALKSAGKKTNRKFSFLLVETLQNILRHGEKLNSADFAHFSFRNNQDALIINSINLVNQEGAQELKAVVDAINGLSDTELKEKWKKQLIQGDFSTSGGAGLGLLEIARKSNREVAYRIDDVDNQVKKFHQQVTYVHESESTASTSSFDYLSQTDKTNRLMRNEDVLFEYKGAINQNMILPMISIIEKCVSVCLESKNKIKAVTHILLEMLQNIPNVNLPGQGIRREGVCLVQHVDNHFVLSTGNLVPNEQVDHLKAKLDELDGKTVNELKVMHVKRMKEVIHSERKTSSRLGLIEIARYANGRIQFTFDKLNESCTFFTLKVIV